MATTKEERKQIFLLAEQGKKPKEIYPLFPHVPEGSVRRIICEERKKRRGASRRDPLADEFHNRTTSDPPPAQIDVENIESEADELKIEVEEQIPGTKLITATSVGRILTLDDLLDAHDVDLEVWRVASWRPNVWEQAQKSTVPGGKPIIIQLHQVKAYLVERPEAGAVIDIRAMREEMRQFAPAYEPPPPPDPKKEPHHALVLAIPDLHYGKSVWKDETGYHYDMDVAEGLFCQAIDVLLSRAEWASLDEIILPVGNDLFTADGRSGLTTKGTPQKTDGDHRLHFRRVRQMVRRAIDHLHLQAPVRVPIVPGNHDMDTVWFLGEALHDWYYNTPTIIVDNGSSPRKYHRYGTTLIGWTHGNEEKHQDLPMVMATESKDDWAASSYREWHTGHYHRKKELRFMPVLDRAGVIIRTIPPLCTVDSWHHTKGYIAGVRQAEAYLYQREKGLVATYSWSPD